MLPFAPRIHPSAMPRYRRYYRDGQTVFLTLVAQGRCPWMSGPAVCREVLAALRAARALHPFSHHAYVLLPDHLHLLLSPHHGVCISDLVGCFKRAAQTGMHRAGLASSGLWQPRYYDHIVRDREDFSRHLDYVHFNPVKHGLSTHAASWPWSSLAAWQARGVYPPTWGAIPPEHIHGMSES